MKEFVIERVFEAPRDRVWQAWTEAERLKQWFAPKDFRMTHCALELRPGGLMHYRLRGPDGKDLWGRWVIREIVKPQKLVFVVSFSDPQAGITVHPMAPDWPREMLSTVELEEQGAKTLVRVRWIPTHATEAEKRAFEDGRESLKMGWTGTLDYLEQYLSN